MPCDHLTCEQCRTTRWGAPQFNCNACEAVQLCGICLCVHSYREHSMLLVEGLARWGLRWGIITATLWRVWVTL